MSKRTLPRRVRDMLLRNCAEAPWITSLKSSLRPSEFKELLAESCPQTGLCTFGLPSTLALEIRGVFCGDGFWVSALGNAR